MTVTLVHAQNELLADVTREIEIDVRYRLEILVEEATKEQIGLYRINV